MGETRGCVRDSTLPKLEKKVLKILQKSLNFFLHKDHHSEETHSLALEMWLSNLFLGCLDNCMILIYSLADRQTDKFYGSPLWINVNTSQVKFIELNARFLQECHKQKLKLLARLKQSNA